MNVTMPDGTVITNVPDDIKQSELVAKVIKMNEKPDASIGERVTALQGGLYRGAAGFLGIPMDTILNVYNLGKAGVGSVMNAAGRPDLAPEVTTGTPLSGEWIAKQMNKIGVNTSNPRPDDAASRMLYTGGTVAGGSAVPGVRPTGAIAAATGGAVAGEMSNNPLAVGLGAMAPGAVAQAASGARVAIANPKTVAENKATFERAGVTPTVGMATESTALRGLENIAAKFPGGVGVFREFAERMQKTLGDKTSTGVSAESAGRAIETGIRGTGGFLDRTKSTWQALDAEVSAKIPPTTGIAPANTLRVLGDLTTPTPGAGKTSAMLMSPRIVEMEKAISADVKANGGQIPYEGIRSLRTQVGSMLDDSLVSGVPNAQLKRVYGALSQDMEAAANAAGAGREFARQNNYYSARMDRIETVLDRVLGHGKQPEDIFKTVMPTDPNQANKLRSTLRSLNPVERQVVTDAVVARMGKATPGNQNEVGDIFSSNTFLTNWNKLSPGAKSQIFPDTKMRGDMDAIASVAANMKEGAKVFANPSGTAGAAAPYGLTVFAAMGNILPVAGIIGGTYATAKLMTSPKIVNWLATAPKVQPGKEAAHLARLAVIMNQEKDPQVKQQIGALITSMEQQ